MQKVCRLCLKTTDQNEIADITNEHLLQLHSVVPEIDLKTKKVKTPLICTSCMNSLKAAYDFKSICLETERRIELYIENKGMVNLVELLNQDCDDDNVLFEEIIDIKQEENNEILERQDGPFVYDEMIDVRIEEKEENHEQLNSIMDDISCTAPKVVNTTLLPKKTQNLYERQYQIFITWCKSQNVQIYSEDIFLTYFNEKAKSHKSSTLWSTYSMLKSMFLAKHNIHLSEYSRLTTFIKQQNMGYNPKQSNIFTREQVCEFLEKAPDRKYLMWKICLIFGIAGACRTIELKNMMTYHIEDKDTVLIIKIPDAKTGKSRTFIIEEKMYDNIKPINLYRKYLSLRPSNIDHENFFIFYSNNKCTLQPIGIHTMGKIPANIASYLKIRDANNYTGHSFRRSSASLLGIDSGLLIDR